MEGESQSRTAALVERLAAMLEQSQRLPGASLAKEAIESERNLGGGLIAGGVAFRIFLWLVPFGLVVAAVLSFWSAHDQGGLEVAARKFGVGGAAAEAAAEALEHRSTSIALVLAVGLTALAWFSLGAIRALVLAYSLAWHLKPARIRRPFRAIAIFNGFFLAVIFSSLAVAWLREQIGASALGSLAITLAFTTVVALAAMWLLPRRATRARELLPGALLVATGNQVLQAFVLFYFAPRLGESEETYGAFGAAATLLVWLYVISRLVTGAAFLNATLWRRSTAAAAETP